MNLNIYIYMQRWRHENNIHNPPKYWFLKRTHFILLFINCANRPGVNRPVRKNDFAWIVPGGTGFWANRPVTFSGVDCNHSPFVSVPWHHFILVVGWNRSFRLLLNPQGSTDAFLLLQIPSDVVWLYFWSGSYAYTLKYFCLSLVCLVYLFIMYMLIFHTFLFFIQKNHGRYWGWGWVH